MGRFEIFKDKRKEFRFRLRAGNGEIILASEGYKAKANCKNGIKSVKVNSIDDNNFISFPNTISEYYFILKATNGRTIGVSESYMSLANMTNGIRAVKANAPISGIVDLTKKNK